jgi:hypothetical protein
MSEEGSGIQARYALVMFALAMFALAICRRSRQESSTTELIPRHSRFVGFDEDGGSLANITASAASQ